MNDIQLCLYCKTDFSMRSKMKPNCYGCKWRRNVVGSSHSSCNHPRNDEAKNNPLMQIMATFAGVGRIPPVEIDTGLHIKGSQWGIDHGWFNWPFNFDPTWLEECGGFTEIQSTLEGGDGREG